MEALHDEACALIDPAEARRALELIIPAGQVTELRALEATVNGDRWAATYTGYFAEPDKLLAAIGTLKSAKGIYVTPNPVDPALIARANNRIRKAGKGDSTSDNDITSRTWLWVDCDATRPAGVSATDAEHNAAIKRARAIADDLHFNYGWADPIVADSGNGGHLQYRIDEPVNSELVEQCLAALAAKFSDDAVKVDTTVHNPARIWKLYGTLACEGDSTTDRPHRMSRILSAPSQFGIVSTALLQSLASEVTTESKKHGSNGATNTSSFDIDGFIARNGFDLAGPNPYQGGRRWTFNRSPLCDHHDDGPFVIQFSNGALSAGCHHESCGWTWHDLRAKYEPKQDSPAIASRRKKRSWKNDAARASHAEAGKFSPRPTTDLGNAERFVEQHGNRVRFIATWNKWVVWDGSRWHVDSTREVWRLAKKTVRSIYTDVARLAKQPEADGDDLEELTAWAKASERLDRIAALLALAANEEGVAIDHTVLDAHQWLLKCPNGTVDLRTTDTDIRAAAITKDWPT